MKKKIKEQTEINNAVKTKLKKGSFIEGGIL